MWLRHIVTHQLDTWLQRYETDESLAYALVLIWTAVLLGGWFFTRRRLDDLLKDSELPL
jgi:hypothetical protein